MDQDLVAYLDRRFAEVRGEIAGARDELRGEIVGVRDGLRAELRTEITGVRDDLRGEIVGLRGEIVGLRGEIAASAVETRRRFDVVAEALMAKLQVVAEGVIAVDEKLGRLRGEVGEEFRKVERRFHHLEARIVR